MASEAFYVVLTVTEDGTREVLGIFDLPTESASGWKLMFDSLKERGLERIELIVSDGLTGLDSVVGESNPGASLQRCVTHLKRDMLCRVRYGDKKDLAADLRRVFRTGDENYTVEKCWQAWKHLCDKWGTAYRSIKRMGWILVTRLI